MLGAVLTGLSKKESQAATDSISEILDLADFYTRPVGS